MCSSDLQDRLRRRLQRVVLSVGVAAVDEALQPPVRVAAVAHLEHRNVVAVDGAHLVADDLLLRSGVADRQVDEHADAPGHRPRGAHGYELRTALDHDLDRTFASPSRRGHAPLTTVSPLCSRITKTASTG